MRLADYPVTLGMVPFGRPFTMYNYPDSEVYIRVRGLLSYILTRNDGLKRQGLTGPSWGKGIPEPTEGDEATHLPIMPLQSERGDLGGVFYMAGAKPCRLVEQEPGWDPPVPMRCDDGHPSIWFHANDIEPNAKYHGKDCPLCAARREHAVPEGECVEATVAISIFKEDGEVKVYGEAANVEFDNVKEWVEITHDNCGRLGLPMEWHRATIRVPLPKTLEVNDLGTTNAQPEEEPDAGEHPHA